MEVSYGTLTEVAATTVAGWIFGAVVYDVTTDEDFIYSEKSGRDPFPVQIPYDHSISVSVSAENTGTESQKMTLAVELIDPDGIVRASRSASGTLSPGTVRTSGRTSDIMPDKFGTWVIHAWLEAETQVLDEKTWDAIAVEIVEVAGRILTAFVRDDTTDELYLGEDLPVSLPVGHLVRVHFSFQNTGETPQNMKSTVKLIDPDGTVRAEKVLTQYTDPGWQKASSRTDPVELDKAGTWVIYAQLEAEGMKVDEKQWDAIIVGVEVANLYGFVYDTGGNPLAAVSITLNGQETASMIDGAFWFLEIEPGDYTITCTKEGYKDRIKTISLPGGRKDVDIEMLGEEEEEEGWWESLETWQQAFIIGGGASAVIALLALATRKKGKGE